MADFRRRSKDRGSRDSGGRNREQKDFNRSDRRSSQKDFSRSDRGPSRDGGRFNKKPSRFGGRNVEMTTVICDSCKKSCEVPFKPSSNKPVYCRDCFSNESAPKSRVSSSNSGNVLGEINYKLDKIMKALKIN